MKIDVTPHTSLLSKIGHASFSIWQSISELIANSLDAMAEDKKAKIYIYANTQRISVKDNGIGMTKEGLEKAVRMAWPMQKYHTHRQGVKSVFGLGMKTACASLGNIWTVRTLPENSDKGFEVIFDLNEFKNKDNSKWEAELREIEPSRVGINKGASSGTVVTIEELNVRPIADNFKKEISRAYLPHIKNGDEFFLNDILLKASDPVLIDNTKVKVNLEVEGIKIQGWGALMKKGSITNFGFHWYRRGQLIESFDKSFIPNHPNSRQIIGELYADDMPVNFTKKGFEKESKEWIGAHNELEAKFNELVSLAKKSKRERQSDALSKRELRKNESVMGRVGKTLTKVFEAEEPNDYILPQIVDRESVKDEKEQNLKLGELSERHPIEVGSEKILWKHVFLSMGEEGPIVDYKKQRTEDGDYEVVIVSNEDSPFFQVADDDKLLAIINVAEAISMFLVENFDYDCLKALKFRDTWLATACAILKKIG